jgi:hypothetical protein
MKRNLTSVIGVFLLVVSIVAGSGIIYFVASIEPGVILSIEPELVSVERNQLFELSVNIVNVKNLYKWTLGIKWDPSIIELEPASSNAVTEGPFLKSVGRTYWRIASYVAGSGYLSSISCELTQLISASGDGTLLTICFRAINNGETNVTISASNLYDSSLRLISHTRRLGHVSVTSVRHDLQASLDAPAKVVAGSTALLMATVSNLGDVDETDVSLAILVNEVPQKSIKTSLPKGGSTTLSFSWTPSYKGIYNITAYATPVIGETNKINNYAWKLVEVVLLSHDLIVSLECPARLVLGKSVKVNANVTNIGTFDETNVSASIIIDGIVKFSKSIPLLKVNSLEGLSYVWGPDHEGTYNVTAYVRPVAGEINIADNGESKFVNVTVPTEILIVADDDGSYHLNGTSLSEFEVIIQSLGLKYDIWKESVQGRPSLTLLLEYKLVIWTCGDYHMTAVDFYDAQRLEQYVNYGGSIILEGGNIAYNHNSDSFMTNVAHARLRMHRTRSPSLTVVKHNYLLTKNLPSDFTWATLPYFDDGVHPVNGGFAVINYTDTPFSQSSSGPWTAVTVFDGTQKGIGSIIYYSFVLHNLPKNQREVLVANSIEWMKRFGISTVLSDVIHASPDAVYFIYNDPHPLNSNSAFDVALGATIYAFCESPQRQGFTSSQNWLTDLGRINSTEISNSIIVVLGNPFNHIVTNYYESSCLTPISLSENSTHFIFCDNSSKAVWTLNKLALESGHEDAFAVQVLKDGQNDLIIAYGVGWKGTWAASMYFANIVMRNLAEYSGHFLVFRWVDDDLQDGIPQLWEIQEVNSG